MVLLYSHFYITIDHVIYIVANIFTRVIVTPVETKNHNEERMTKKVETETVDESKRDLLGLTAASMAAIGAGAAGWTVVDSMNPAKDTLALATTEANLGALEEGNSMTVVWRGKPVFIRHRTAEEIKAARDVKMSDLKDPESDTDRVKNDKYLVMVGICSHLGCVPSGQKPSDTQGEYNGWFCPCHGSQYDTSGRIRKGPAPTNMAVPPYEFISDTVIKIG